MMQTGMIIGVLFFWSLFIGLTIFMVRGLSQSNGSDGMSWLFPDQNALEDRYVRVEVESDHSPFQVKDKH